MIITLVCLAALHTTTAQDFFPSTPGTVRTYEAKSGEELTNTIGKTLDMGGVDVIPVTESTGSSMGKTTYYRVEPDQVTIVAYDVTKPLVMAMPILKLGSGVVKWDYQGSTQAGLSGERLLEHGESHLAGQRTVLGKKVDVLVVTLDAAVGMGLSGVTFEQTTVYARGIGMVEMKTKQKLGRKTVEESYKLVTFEPGK